MDIDKHRAIACCAFKCCYDLLSEELQQAVSALNEKWFWYALRNPENKRSILGFDMSY